jgi:hypothetical protein
MLLGTPLPAPLAELARLARGGGAEILHLV